MDSTPRSNSVSQYVVLGTAIIVVILAVAAIRSLTREKVAIRTAQVTYGDLVKSFSTNGKVQPVDDFQVHAPAPGQIQDVYVDLGDKVKPGQLLLRLDDKPALANLAHANSSLQAAQLAAADIHNGGSQEELNSNAANLSRATLQRQQDASALAALQQLQAKGAASAGEIAAAQHRVETDDLTIRNLQQHTTQRYGQGDQARAQAEVADARAALAAAQSNYETQNIRSKIAGSVYYLPVSQYDYVTTGDDLVYVADLTRMRITAYFDEPDIGNLAAGQKVTITWEAKPGRIWHGHITQAPTTVISYLTRFVGECFIAVDDAEGDLKPNANVNITVVTAQHQHVLNVPREALRYDGGKPYVFRVVGHKLVKTPINISGGIVNLNEVEIVGGLSEGDTVALNATTNRDLTNGLQVTPVQ